MGAGAAVIYAALLITMIALRIKSPSQPHQEDQESKVIKTSTWVTSISLVMLFGLVVSFLTVFSEDQTLVFLTFYQIFEIIAGVILPLNFVLGLPNLKHFAHQYFEQTVIQFRNRFLNVTQHTNRVDVTPHLA